MSMTLPTPTAPDAESAVLTSCIIDPDAVNSIRDLLAPEDFYSEVNRHIYRAILEVEVPDMPSLVEYFRARNMLDVVSAADIVGLSASDLTATGAWVTNYARDVKRASDRRRAIHGLQKALSAAYNSPTVEDALNIAEAELLALARSSQAGQWLHIDDAIAEARAEMIEARAAEEIAGVTTGLVDLDALITSMRPGTLNVLAARPSLGKSALAFTIAAQNIMHRNPKRVAIFSLEMTASEIVSRMMALDTGHRALTMTQMRNIRRLTDAQFERAEVGFQRLSGVPLWIDDTAEMSPNSIRSQARALSARHPLDLIVIDYLQLMTLGGDNETQALAAATQKLKILARELNCPILLLSQLNRKVEERPNKRPILSDLRGSGGIEQDADLVMFIYRDDYYYPETDRQGIAEIIIGKQRNGPAGVTAEVAWLSDSAKFANLATDGRY